MQQRTDILLIAQGEYSDYRNAAFKVLRPFTFAEQIKVFREIAEPSYYDTEDFINWLNARGYIEDLNIHEVCLGSYRLNDSIASKVLMRIQFAPSSEN